MFSHVVAGREDSYSLDGSGGDRIQEVHLSQRRVELRDRHVGGDVIRRETVLGDVQSRCKFDVMSLWKPFVCLLCVFFSLNLSNFELFTPQINHQVEICFHPVGGACKECRSRQWP